MPEQSKNLSWRAHLHEVIFEADTPSGKAFDVALLVAILLSVAVVVLDSVAGIHARYGTVLRIAEWLFTILFTVEYVLRLISVRRPLRYATSFLGIVDLLAIVPTYASLFVTGAQSLLVIRALRLLRIFRIFKAVRFVGEMGALTRAIKSSGPKIVVFLFAVLTAVLIMGTLMYVVEGEDNGFTSIPVAMYWAVVTVTTVGYGDITPKTVPGQMVAAVAMILGYSLIIIPTAIFSMELVQASRKVVTTQSCPSCSHEGHDADAEYCKFCGAQL
jgi:voltage-gated potassium channel